MSRIFAIALVSLFSFILGCSSLGKAPDADMKSGMQEYKDGDISKAKIIFEKQCQVGERAGCIYLGIILKGQGQPELAKEVFEKACNLKSDRACAELGKLEFASGNLLVARHLFERTCDSIYWACQELGILELAQNNVARAKNIFEKQCKSQHSVGCVLLGMMAEETGDFSGAHRYYSLGCKMKGDTSCHFFGRMELLVGDKDNGRKLIENACANGVGQPCRIRDLLAQLDQQPNIKQIWTRECNSDKKDACYALGLEQSLNRSTYSLSKITFQKSCKLGNGLACTELANLLSPYKDHKRYAELILEACNKGSGTACTSLQAGGFPYDVTSKPGVLIEKGCALGDGKACSTIADRELLLDQNESALRSYKMGCENGFLESCYWQINKSTKDENERVTGMVSLCKKNYALACAEVGDAMRDSSDIDSAKEFYQKACDSYDLRSCWWLIDFRSKDDKSFNKPANAYLKSPCEVLG